MVRSVPHKSITREDVARLANVSTAVVSYVMNDGPRPVAARTRQRVLDAVEQLGYRPNARARALKLGTNCTYGLAVPDVTNTFHAAIVAAIDGELSARGWSMLLAHSHKDTVKERQVVTDMIDRGVEGMIVLMSTAHDDEWLDYAIPVPAVQMDRQRGLFGYATIGPDYVSAGVQATEHLLSHGRTRIVPVYGNLITGDRNLRLSGYREAMYRADVPEMPPVVTEWSREGGYQAGLEILQRDPLPDAVFCFSDMIGVGMIQALQKQGIRVPEEIAVVCFDGTEASKFTYPALTTVAQPVAAMAAAAVEALAGPRPEGLAHQMFPVTLVKRQSCGCEDM